MKILMLIPQAFYSTRGTPLSAYHRARYIENLGHKIDILTYPIGDQPPELNVNVYRSRGPHFSKQIKQGPSYLKIWFDGIFFLNLIFRLLRKQYDLIYAHEEAGFMYALLLKLFKIPLVYDMHSSLPLQIQEWGFSKHKFVIHIFRWVERFSLRQSRAVVAISPGVCKAAKRRLCDTKVFIIPNSFEIKEIPTATEINRVRAELGIRADQKIVLYTGSFVALQALDLLIKSVPEVIKKNPETKFVLIGGKDEEIKELRYLADELGVTDHILMLTARPQKDMATFMAASDVLVSPRVIGINPPGKLLSYLNSGKPVVLTDCYVHNQLVDPTIAILAKPNPFSFGEGIIKGLNDFDYACKIVTNAKRFVNVKFSYDIILDGYKQLLHHIESFQKS